MMHVQENLTVYYRKKRELKMNNKKITNNSNVTGANNAVNYGQLM